MALKDIVFRRLEMLLGEALQQQDLEVDWDTKLGGSPLRLDDVYIQGELRGRLNGAVLGFADLLKAGKRIESSDIDKSTTVQELVVLILDRSSFDSRDQYEAKMSERVRLGLRHHIANLAQPPVAEDAVLLTATVGTYVSPGSLEALRAALTDEFEKYLIGGAVRPSDLNGTVGDAADAIVLHMLA